MTASNDEIATKFWTWARTSEMRGRAALNAAVASIRTNGPARAVESLKTVRDPPAIVRDAITFLEREMGLVPSRTRLPDVSSTLSESAPDATVPSKVATETDHPPESYVADSGDLDLEAASRPKTLPRHLAAAQTRREKAGASEEGTED
jgi:hypothetical protein